LLLDVLFKKNLSPPILNEKGKLKFFDKELPSPGGKEVREKSFGSLLFTPIPFRGSGFKN